MTTTELRTPKSPSTAGNGRSRRRLWIAAIATLVVVIGVLAILVVHSNQQLSDTEANLADTEADLEQTAGRLEAQEQLVGEQASEISSLEGRNSIARQALAGLTEDYEELSAQYEEADLARSDFVDMMAAMFGYQFGVEELNARCMAEIMVSEGRIGEAFAGVLAGTSDQAAAMSFGLEMMQAGEDCGVPLNVFPDAVQPGFSYGDNPALDDLYDLCASGSGAACDQLYWLSPVGSDYEQFGATCGNRYEVDEAPASCGLQPPA